MMRRTIFRHWRKLRNRVPELGDRHTICNWVREESDGAPDVVLDMQRYSELLTLLPDRTVSYLERARLQRDGRAPMLKAGLGYEELLSAVIVDGTAVHDSSTENLLFPDLSIPANYLQPGGIPGRTIRWRASGRVTTLSTAATLIVNLGHAATAATTVTTSWAKTGAVTMDGAVHTNEHWFTEGVATVRSVGSAGTIFAQGEFASSAAAFTLAQFTNTFMGSAGSATPSTATIDMTIAEFLVLSAKWSLTTAYSITGHLYLLEALN